MILGKAVFVLHYPQLKFPLREKLQVRQFCVQLKLVIESDKSGANTEYKVDIARVF